MRLLELYLIFYPLESSVELTMLGNVAPLHELPLYQEWIVQYIEPHKCTCCHFINDTPPLGRVSLFANTNYLIFSSATDFSEQH